MAVSLEAQFDEKQLAMRSTYWRNLFWLGSATVGSMVGSMIYGILVARYLGPLDFGRFSLVVGVGGWLIALAQGSGTTALLVLAAQERHQAGQLLLPGTAIQASVGVVATLVSLPTVWILSGDTSLFPLVVLYGLASIAFLLYSVPISIYRGLDRMEWGLAFTGTSFVLVLLVFGVIVLDLGITATVAANTISQIVMLLILWPLAWRGLMAYRKEWNHKLSSRLWFASMALWGVTIVQALHWRVGLVMVQILAGCNELGLYTAAAKPIENLRAIPWFLLMAILPAFAQASQSNRDKLGDLIRRALRYVLLIAFPLCVLLVTLSPIIIDFLYTPEYEPSAGVFMICSFGLVPLFAHWVFLNTMVSLHLERGLIITYIISILSESVLDLLLVPIWGSNGAALGYVVGEFMAAIASGIYVMRAVGGLGGGALLRIVIPGSLSLAVVCLQLGGTSLFARVSIACLGYILGVFVFKAITISEIRRLLWQRPLSAALD